MMKKIFIRNKSTSELGVMLEPWTSREDIDPGQAIEVTGDFSDKELVVDVGDENFISVWAPPGSTIKKVS